MLRLPIAYAALVALLMACSSSDKAGISDSSIAFELMKMQEQGKIDSLIMDQALSTDDVKLKKMGIETCGMVRDRMFSSDLDRLCRDSDMEIRNAAIFALGEIRDTGSINPLVDVLYLEDLSSQILAIEALGKIGDREAAPFVRPFLNKTEDEAFEAALALWRMADSSSLDYLREFTVRAEGRALYGAIYAMSRITPDSCIPEFAMVFDNENAQDSVYPETKAIAARGLGAGGDTAAVLYVFERYFDTLDRPAKIELIRSMGKTGVGRGGLEQILEDTDDDGLKRVILLSLGEIGSSKSEKIIEKYIRDRSLEVQLAAISAVPDVNKKSPTNILTQLKFSRKWQVRAEVARALGKVKSRRSLGQLRLMLEDSDDRVKAAVIEGLGESPVRRNIDIINAALNGAKDVVVRSVAADVLGTSGDSKAGEILIDAAERNADTGDIDFARSLVAALGKFVDTTAAGQDAAGAIRLFLDHPDRIVRQDAHAALGALGAEDFDPGIFDVDFSEEDFRKIEDLEGRNIIASIETERGTITVKLEPSLAPRTVSNFVKLAERGFYDNLTFHRVVQDFVIQGGCPRGDGWGGPGYMIREEINPLRFRRGTIGMATSGRDTGGSQFFICMSDQPHLDGRYTAFGNVIDGLDVMDKIEIGDKINSIKIEKGRF